MSFTNLYYKRTTATAKSCYVCYKPTNTVLATINTVDFLYTCPGHLIDPGFASTVGDTSDGAQVKAGVTPEEIAKIKEEWEEKQRKRLEKEKEKQNEKDKEKDDKNEDKGKEKDTSKKGEGSKSPKVQSTLPSGSVTPSTPTHHRYTLHRDFFAMRLSEHKKRRQTAQAKELGPRLPGAPKGGLPESN